MEHKAVSDTGPILHLEEVDLINILKIFKKIYIPPEIKKELKCNKIKDLLKNIKIKILTAKSKQLTEIFINEYEINLGESQAIALGLQEKVKYFLTDDLDARFAAEKCSLEPHGTMGIIIRAFREKVISKKIAIQKIQDLYEKSSLFITTDLINFAIKSIKKYKQAK